MASYRSRSAILPEMHIHELPYSNRQQLCDHLDQFKVWTQLADFLSLANDDKMSIKKHEEQHKSPTMKLLDIWGGTYNHTVDELFAVLYKNELYTAIDYIRDYVVKESYKRKADSLPKLTSLMAQTDINTNQTTKKKLNIPLLSEIRANTNPINDLNSKGTTDENDLTSTIYTESSIDSKANQSEEAKVDKRDVKKYARSIPEFDYNELTNATNNWHDNRILGKGGFGTVYHGILKYTDFAIKQIHYSGTNNIESNIKMQFQQSLNELKYLNECRHDNVVPLYGYSIKGDKPCLVYQYLCGGSLDKRLNAKNAQSLTCLQRLRVCLGTARGINYLHTFRQKPLIHGDIKPANILLDECLKPKIGDFGLAREGPNAIDMSVMVSQVYGTRPYLPPEFISLKKLSTQVDTYSFGVVLLETFTGLRVYDKNRQYELLPKHCRKYLSNNTNRIDGLIDSKVPLQPGELDNLQLIIDLGMSCIADNWQERPTMEDVLKTLHFISRRYHPTVNFY